MRRVLASLLLLPVASLSPAQAADDPIAPAESASETTPVATTGDSMDDPAVWVHPSDRSRSLVLGNNKLGALETYDLEGNRVQRISDDVTFWGNVDVRQRVKIAGKVRDIVAVYHRGLQLYRVNPSTQRLTRINEGVAIPTAGEGLCLYTSPANRRVYAFVIAISGVVRQFRDPGPRPGTAGSEPSRSVGFAVGSEAEGCLRGRRARRGLHQRGGGRPLAVPRAEPGAAPRRRVRRHRGRAPGRGTSKASRWSTCPEAAATSSRQRRTSPTRTTRSSSSTTA